MNPSCKLFLIGPMGAGKTSIGRRLAPRFGLGFVDLDHEIETATGAAIPMIFEHEGETGFRQRESQQLRQCSAMRSIVLACGGGVVLDAGNRKLLTERGFVVHLDISVEQQLARLRCDQSRPLLASPDRRQRLEAMAEQRNHLYASVADLQVQGGDANVAQASKDIARRIEQVWQRSPVGPETST